MSLFCVPGLVIVKINLPNNLVLTRLMIENERRTVYNFSIVKPQTFTGF